MKQRTSDVNPLFKPQKLIEEMCQILRELLPENLIDIERSDISIVRGEFNEMIKKHFEEYGW